MRHCPYKGMFSSLYGGPAPPRPSSPPCFLRAQPDQQRTPALGPRSRNGVQFHHQLIKIDRKYKLLLNFYYYYFYPLGSCVSTKLALIKHVVPPAHSLLWFSRRPSGSWCTHSPHGWGWGLQRKEGL